MQQKILFLFLNLTQKIDVKKILEYKKFINLNIKYSLIIGTK